MSYANEEIEVLKHDDFCKEKLHFEGLCIDKYKRIVVRDENEIELTYTEFEILLLLAQNAGIVFSKYSYEDFKAAYDRLSQNIKEFTELKEMEYAAITHHEDVEYQHDVKYFKAEEVALSESLKEYISRIIKIHRLREVRVLTGFTRLEAPEPEVDEQSHIVKLKCSSGEKWLPAVEINGEGVFIELNKEKK